LLVILRVLDLPNGHTILGRVHTRNRQTRKNQDSKALTTLTGFVPPQRMHFRGKNRQHGLLNVSRRNVAENAEGGRAAGGIISTSASPLDLGELTHLHN